MKSRSCILILGMHRSGTSALSGLIHQLGFDFGASITEPSWDNPRGFYENYKIQDLNDDLLSALGKTWDTPGLIDKEDLNLTEIEALKSRAKKLVKRDFQGSRWIAIKDPRICLLFPFWQSVLAASGYDLSVVTLLREPSEIAASLKKRNFFSESKSHLLTASHWLSAEHATRGLQRSFVTFDDLLRQPDAIVQFLIDKLVLAIESIDESREGKISSSINRELRHFKSSDDHLPQEDEFLTQQIHDAVLDLSREGEKEEIHQRLDAYRKQFIEYDTEEIKRLSGKQQYFAKLIYDDGGGFSEAKTKSKPIDQKTEGLSFSLDPLNEIRRLVIFPANAPCIIKINSISLDFVGEEVSYVFSDNAYSVKNSLYTFKEAFPQIIIELKLPAKVSQIHLDLVYHEIGMSPDEDAAVHPSKGISNSVLSVLIKYPIRALKSINLNNYRTLRRAIKRENPRTIVRNFVKLLKRPDHQKLITSTSSKNKADFINKNARSLKIKSNSSNQTKPNQTEKKLCQVLYLAPALPEYDTSSGGKRATKILELLNTRSSVSILTRQTPVKKYKMLFESYGVDVFHLSSKKLKELLPNVDVIICAWYYTFYEIADIRLLYPDARIIIDSVDVHWVREERSLGILKDLTAERVKQNKAKEIKAYDGADVIWAVSEEDREAIIKELPGADVSIVSNIHSFERTSYVKPDQSNLLFIGGYDHYPNISAAIKLAKEIFPIVRAQCSEAQLILVGSNAPQEILELDQLEGVTFIGWVTSEEIEALYDKTLLSVAPLLTGAGIKGKITEAISYMTPVVTNAIGNEGIHLEHEVSGLLAESDEAFAKVIIEAIRGEHNLAQIARQAQERIKTIVGPEKALNAMWHSFYKPVDICIVTYNRLDLLKACIESIVKHTIHPNYNIIVYSNACSDGTREYLRDLAAADDKVTPIISDNNEVFVRPNNKMMELHNDRDVILLNNDVEVTHGWLIGLSIIAYRSSQVGIVGSKILYPDERLQEFGSELYEDGTGVNIGKGDNPDRKEYSKSKAAPYVSGCAMYIKRSTIKKIGTFDDAFHPCYCEDSDYCYTAWEHGISTLVTPYSSIYHHEGSTSGTDTSQGFKKYQAINMKKFWAKHSSQLKSTRKAIKKANKALIKDLNRK